jgi:hypothetical protein
MTKEKEYHLNVPHITQIDCQSDTPEMCGAACVQMVLHDIDSTLNLSKTKGEQTRLYKSIGKKSKIGTGSWYNPPDGMAEVLNALHPAIRRSGRTFEDLPSDIQSIFSKVPVASSYGFSVVGGISNGIPGIPKAYDSTWSQIAQIELISRLLIRTITISGAAPLVTVREDNAHWVVVNGFQVYDDYVDTGAIQPEQIKSMIIRNPLGRYNYRDIECASLPGRNVEIITGHTCEENSYPQDIVAYETWVREYMFDDWAETFVMVCDHPAQVAPDLVRDIDALSRPSSRRFSTGISEKPISAEDAKGRASSAIGEYKLRQWNDGINDKMVLSPIKVKRLDRTDGDYYLVPVGTGVQISALINISATGEFSEATVWPSGHFIAPFENHPNFSRLIGPESLLIGKKLRLGSGDSLFKITTVSRDTKDPYVWRPCYESFSSFRPFHHLKVNLVSVDSVASKTISIYLPVDNYCLNEVEDSNGEIQMPSPNYLEILTDCIKKRLKKILGKDINEDIAVLTMINRRGDTLLVEYQTNQKRNDTKKIIKELERVKDEVCQCLNENPGPKSLAKFRIKAFRNANFLTRKRGGTDDDPLPATPKSGGGGNDVIEIAKCKKSVPIESL